MRGLPIILLALAGCASTVSGQTFDEEAMLVKASALTKVAAAAESAVRYKAPPEDLSERELLEFAAAHDPGLLDPFTGYGLRILRKERHAVVLLCSPDARTRLLEDAGCTAAMDVHHWRHGTDSPCEFSLDPGEVCPAP